MTVYVGGPINPGSVSGISVANPAGIGGGVDIAHTPDPISGVVNNYGLQQTPFIGSPTSINVGNGSGTLSSDPSAFNSAANNTFSNLPKTVYAPKLDLAAVNAQARTAAENAVNPFYTKTLNDFLAEQAAAKQQKEEQTATDIQNLQDTLKHTQESNALTGARTAEDTTLKTGQINTTQDQNQVVTGDQFETDRIAAARAAAASGTLGSGAGNRAASAAIIKRNTAEGQQNDQFQQAKDAAALAQARTFQDLSTSNDLATEAEAKGEKQSTFDLNNYIKNATFTEQDKRNALEEQRLQAISQEQSNQAKLLYSKYLQSISDPAQYAAAASTYGGSF